MIRSKGYLPELRKLGLDKDNEKAFVTKMMLRGVATIEKLIDGKEFCVGDSLTMADLFFVPQMRNIIEVWKIDMSNYPKCVALYEKLKTREIFLQTHPKNQPGAAFATEKC